MKTAVLVGGDAVAFTRESFMNSLNESVNFGLRVPHEQLTCAWICLTDGIGCGVAEVQNS